MEDAIEEYQSSLEDLTFNSKPHINNLTILADESKKYASQIVKLVEAHLAKASNKLPIMYLLDSIIKNVGENYKPLFAKNIVITFKMSFESSDDKGKMALYKLRTTWDAHFPLKRLFDLDTKIRTMDPNWPIKPLPASLQDAPGAKNIHVNPKFLKKGESLAKKQTPQEPKPSATSSKGGSNDVDKIKQQLVQQQKELLELQQRKLMLELEQTKQQLEAKQKELSTNPSKKMSDPLPHKDPRAKPAIKGSLKVTVPNKKPGALPQPLSQKPPSKDPRLKAVQNPKPTKPDASIVVKPNGKRVGITTDKESNPVRIAPILKKKKPNVSPNKAKPQKDGVGPNRKVAGKDLKKKQQNSDLSSSPVSDQDRRKKRSYRNKARSPTPPPSKVPRNSSPSRCPARSISPNNSVSLQHRRMEAPNRRVQRLLDQEVVFPETTESSDGSLSPAFSPEPDTDDGQLNAVQSRLQRPSKHSRPTEVLQRRKSVDPSVEIPQELTLGHQNEILRQANAQLQNGQLTHEQHQELLKQLHQLFELQRVRKMQGGPALSPMVRKLPGRGPRKSLSPIDPRLRRQLHMPDRPHNRAPRFPSRGPRLDRRMVENAPDELGRVIPKRLYNNDAAPLKPIPRRPFLNKHGRAPPPKIRNRTSPVGEMERPDPRLAIQHRQKHPHMREHPRDFVPEEPRPTSTREPINLSPPDFMRRREHEPQKKRGDGKSLRNYAHPEEKSILAESEFVKDKMHGDTGRRNNIDMDSQESHGLEEPEDYIIANMPKVEKQMSFEEPEDYIIANIPDNENPPACEEPEDYIIANMPPGAEAYHKHSMGLKKNSKDEKAYMEHIKRLKKSKYMRELSNSSKNDIPSNGESTAAEEDVMDSTASGDLDSASSKKLDEAIKSPPLPLKKRRYVSADSEKETTMETSEVSDGSTNEIEKLKGDDHQSINKDIDVQSENLPVLDEPQPDEIDQKPPAEDIPQDIEAPKNTSFPSDVKENADNTEDVDSDKLDLKSEIKHLEEDKMDESAAVFDNEVQQKLDENPLVYVIDEEEDEQSSHVEHDRHYMPRRGHPPPFRPGYRRPRDFGNNEEERIQRMLEDEKKNLEWEDTLHHQLEMEERRSQQERRRGRPFPRFGRGRGRDGPLLRRPPPDRWNSPDHDMDEPPPFDVSRGRIRNPMHGRPPPMREGHPRRREPHYPPFRTISPPPPPPDFHGEPRRPLSPPPGRRFPPSGRFSDERVPPWDRPRDERYRHELRNPPAEESRVRSQPEPPAEPKSEPAVMKQVNVNKLLSDLLNMGIIPGASKASETKSESPVPKTSETSKVADTVAPVAKAAQSQLVVDKLPVITDKKPVVEVPPKVEERPRSISPLEEDLMTFDPDANLPQITFSSDLKIRHDELVKRLYVGIQCSACGLRFTTRQTDIYAEHLDWHYRLNRKDKEGGAQAHREIYPTAGDWICNEEVEDPTERDKNAFFEGEEADNETEELTVPLTGRPGEDACKVCKEAFETVYSEADDEWQFTNCVKVGDDNFHSSCYEDYYDGPPVQTPIKTSLSPLAAETDDIPSLELQEEPAAMETEMSAKDETASETHAATMETAYQSPVADDPINKEDVDTEISADVVSEKAAASEPGSPSTNATEQQSVSNDNVAGNEVTADEIAESLAPPSERNPLETVVISDNQLQTIKNAATDNSNYETKTEVDTTVNADTNTIPQVTTSADSEVNEGDPVS